MYYKNESDTKAVVINTVIGKLGVRPQQIIKVTHKIIPPIPSSLLKATEEEYLFFCKTAAQTKESSSTMETTAGGEACSVDTTVDTQNLEVATLNSLPIEEQEFVITEILETTDNNENSLDVTKDLNDDDVTSFVKTLLSFKGGPESVALEQELTTQLNDIENTAQENKNLQADTLKVVATTKEQEYANITEKLNLLRQDWLNTKTVRKKEKIQKQIKELEKQQNKLK